MKYNKLVRDKIPEIIKKVGDSPITHVASDTEYKGRLNDKLQEEVYEFLEGQNKEELADILEVIYAFCDLHSISREELEQTRKEKSEKRGAFKNKIILDQTN